MPIALRKQAQYTSIRQLLTLEIAAALAFKAAALAVIYFAFFGPSHRVEVTAERATQVLLEPMPANRRN